MRSPEIDVSVDNVRVRFGRVDALSHCTFEVPRGTITALLGPNGAGKTTAIRTITGAVRPTEGTVRTLGGDPSHEDGAIRKHIGIVSAKPALYDRLSGWDNLAYSAALYGISSEGLDSRINAAAATFGIEDALPQLVGGFSTGMKTRLALARSILHEPALLLFDEPTSGLDPESSAAVLELIKTFRDNDSTVVLCTHLLSEAEGLADHVVVIDEGATRCSGSPEELARQYFPNRRVRITLAQPMYADPVLPSGCKIDCQDPLSLVIGLPSFDLTSEVVHTLVNSGAEIRGVEEIRPTLERIYFATRTGPDLGQVVLPDVYVPPSTIGVHQ